MLICSRLHAAPGRGSDRVKTKKVPHRGIEPMTIMHEAHVIPN
jgi:hypothetical protein